MEQHNRFGWTYLLLGTALAVTACYTPSMFFRVTDILLCMYDGCMAGYHFTEYYKMKYPELFKEKE